MTMMMMMMMMMMMIVFHQPHETNHKIQKFRKFKNTGSRFGLQSRRNGVWNISTKKAALAETNYGPFVL